MFTWNTTNIDDVLHTSGFKPGDFKHLRTDFNLKLWYGCSVKTFLLSFLYFNNSYQILSQFISIDIGNRVVIVFIQFGLLGTLSMI